MAPRIGAGTRTCEVVHAVDAHKDGQRCVARGETLAEVYGELRGMVGKVSVEVSDGES